MTPGPIGINSATYVGYTTIADCYGTSYGILGSIIATFAVVLPSFLLMLTISKFFSEIPETSFRGSGYSVDSARQWSVCWPQPRWY